MRRISIAILVLSILTSVVGCAKQEQDAAMPTQTEMVETLDSQETVVEETVNKREVVAARTDYLTEADMQSASPWKVCDNSAIAAVMKKAEAGESITIATIGGSITQGTISNGTLDREVKEKKCYADIFFSWWKETFPEVEVKVVNAGIGATDSYLGVHRVQKDVLDYQPDLVLVEYSVNDDASNTYKKSYDNLVRKILKSENAPAVLLLFMGQTNLSSAQSVHQLVGFNYGLPMVSYLNLISDFMDSGRYTAKDLAGDVTHPSALGHAITGEMLWKYLNHIYANIDSYEEPVPFEQKGITKDTYLSAEMLGVGEILPDVMGTFAENKNFNGWGDAWTTTEGDLRLLVEI